MKSFNYKFNNDSILKIGFRSPGLRHLSAIEKMKLAVEFGMSIIEPQIVPKEINSLKKAREYKKAADDLGVKVESTGSLIPHFATDNEFCASVESTMKYMDAMDVKYCFTVIKNEHNQYSKEKAWDLTVERSRMIAEKFAKNNWIYAIEIDKSCFINTVERLKELIRQTECENIYVNYDPTNYYMNGEDPIRVFRTFKNRIISGHIKDANGNTPETYIGKGEMDYAMIFEEMIRTGKEYAMFIEHCNSEDIIRKAAAYIGKILDNKSGQGA